LSPTQTGGKRPAREQTTLEFPDNAKLASLGGAHQKNLVQIERKLGVRVAMRGNLVAVEGASKAREQAAAVLRALYARIEGGENRRSRPLRPAWRGCARRHKAPISI
jgi:phosphate starvation-inducible protein PhoH